jgi:hypothetical protein
MVGDAVEDGMTVNKGDKTEAHYVADILPGGSGENGRYVIVGLKLAVTDGPPASPMSRSGPTSSTDSSFSFSTTRRVRAPTGSGITRRRKMLSSTSRRRRCRW